MAASHFNIVAVQIVVVLTLFVLYQLQTGYFRKFVFYFPPASCMMVLGLILGGLFKLSDEILEVFDFNPSIFFSVLLPPIIFHAGLALPKGAFFRNFGSILLLSFAGTILASLMLGALIYGIGSTTGVELSFISSMVLGSSLAAVDPVSTIAVFQHTGVNVQLYTLVFGESVLNDAVAIVINREFVSLANDTNSQVDADIIIAFLIIIGVAIGSTLMGSAFGLISALIHKHSSIHKHPPLELALLVSFAYLSFIVAEESKLSGIMSSLFCAIVMDHYALWNVSKDTVKSAESLWTMLADVAESFVFVYLGMACFTFDNHDVNVGFSAFVLLFCILSRLAMIFPLCSVLNVKRKYPIAVRQQFVMWMSGLRGAVAFALAIDSPVQHRNVFVTTTLIVSFLTTILFGGATYPVLNWLRLTKDADDALSPTDSKETKHWFIAYDREWFAPFFRLQRNKRRTRSVYVPDSEHVVPKEVEQDEEVSVSVPIESNDQLSVQSYRAERAKSYVGTGTM